MARKDSAKYIASSGWQEDIRIETPDGLCSLEITGWATNHRINFDTDGNAANTKNVHICLKEKDLTSQGYPVRNSDGEVMLLKHRIHVKHENGNIRSYKVIEHLPSETFGLIVCILGDYAADY